MNELKTIAASLVLLSVSSVWAQDNQGMMPGMMHDPNMMPMQQQNMQPGGYMPMMGGGNYEMMMDPVMRRNMMQMRQQQISQGKSGPIMGGGNYEMMMDPIMRENMMQRRQQYMSQSRHPGMNQEMMQGMMKMREAHMQNMEQRLDRIESLLYQILNSKEN